MNYFIMLFINFNLCCQQEGHVQLFSVPGRRLLDSVYVEDDVVNAVAAIPGGPYIMLGCESGNCRVVLVSSRTGTSGGGVDNGLDPAAGLSMKPYRSKNII